MELIIVNESKHAVPRRFIAAWSKNLVRYLVQKKILSKVQSRSELTLVFLDAGPAKKLNYEFRKKNYATDVLSFESMDENSLGELVMCPEVLKRQAKEHGLTYQRELGYMVLHGVLHLLGYDHETGEKDAALMFKIQDEAFEFLLGQL